MTLVNTKTSDEASATALSGSDIVRISQQSGGVWASKKTTLAMVAALAVSGAGNLDWFFVNGNTDAAWTTAVAAVNASPRGGVLYVQAALHANLPGTYTFTKPCRVIGAGRADENMNNAPTEVQCASATANLFHFTVNPWAVENIHLSNTSSTTPTAGAGIYGENGSGHRLNGVSTVGFWNNWQIDNAAEYFWDDCVSFGPVNYAAYIRDIASPDGGDMGISNCLFIAKNYNALAGIRWESGGGLRLTNVKFNNRGSFMFTNELDVHIVASAATSDMIVVGGSMENVAQSCIRLRNDPGGTLRNIVITGVQFANYGAGFSPIDIEATSTGVFDQIVISALDFRNGSSTVSAINIANVDNVAIGVCTQEGHPQLVTITNVTDFRNDNARLGTMPVVDATPSLDCTNAENFNWSLGADRAMPLPTNCASGVTGTVRVHLNGHALTFASGWKFLPSAGVASGTAPTPTGTGTHLFSFQYDGFDNTYVLGYAGAAS